MNAEVGFLPCASANRDSAWDPETGEMVEIDEELSAAIEEAVAQADRGEGIPWKVFRKELFADD
jgi:hypothetical protein